ncbi:Fe(3+) dicitrate transport protein [Methylohalomonas lacus]|uniref:Fe(3+) dicitrate transport protein n=1 Tax=Methylohalomonas lacus TaxID=398773 RepID=A0AAE3L0I1_9GAMM|nr:TonB-dependent receptor [Methylohalomonas lacus]MCS3902065.1 Fe(3+) dicitrate transport protein [Methylohalomonas lacus]
MYKYRWAPLAHLLAAGFVAAVPAAVLAQDTADSDSASILNQVDVIGDPTAIYTIPGSADYVDAEEFREFGYDDINRVLRRTPGVYLREEDGYGLFPNISLRGVDTSRSAKVTLMEDGVLAAPAPYSAPSAYYSPTTGRMSGIEVLKGSSQIQYGPQTTGGAINYRSTPIPTEERTYLRGQFGSDREYRAHAYHGNTVDTDIGRVGYLAEFYLRDTEGFKSIDTTPDFQDGDETGFHNIEPMIKLAWEPNTDAYNRFEFKYGYTDKEADETYLGLTTPDFRRDPNRRYSASRFDNIDTEHHRTHLRHFFSPHDDFDLVTTAYYNEFKRNWYKLASTSAGDISEALAGGAGLDCLRGDAACDLNVRANRRSYRSYGIQTEATQRFDTGTLAHEVTVGLRYHEDYEERKQEEDTFNQAANGTITDATFRPFGSRDNRKDSAEAIAVFIQDRIEYGDWWVTPGLRYEHIDYERDDRLDSTNNGKESLDVVGGGIGAGYNWTDEWQTFGGIHFGFSPPGPGGAIGGQEEETSIAYELGSRYASRDGVLTAEAVAFLTEFDDMIVVDNIGATGSGDSENLGEVRSYGLELSGQFDLGLAQGWSFSNPYHMAYTYTNAEQRSSAASADAESIFSFGAKGNKVPYIPEHQLNVGTALEFARWGTSLNVTYVDETFTSANNVSTEVNGDGDPDARFGKTDSYTLVDLGAHYKLQPNTKLFGGVHNLLDREYIVSRQPLGPRPGIDRTWFVGIELEL